MHPAEEPSAPESADHLRQRLAADLASGRTVSLSPTELAQPDLRERLPMLLEELERTQRPGDASRLHVPGYTVLGEIGQGGMSTVYLARHDSLGRHVALKVVPNWLGSKQRAKERVLREARAMARVVHPNIVAIHDVVEHGDTLAIAMEWVDGLTLAALLRQLPQRPSTADMTVITTCLGTPPGQQSQFGDSAMRWFVRVIRDVARAVHCVHQAGLLHLDVKPSNILVRRDGTPLLADFGVVREIDAMVTHTLSFAGTPIYSAPEQLRREDRSFGPATDVYGLGITLYEVLARAQPLQQEGLTGLLRALEAGRVPPLSSRVAVASDLENIVHRAIAPEAHRRYPSAAALAEDLEAFLEHRPVAARPLSRLARLQRWAHNEPWKAVLAAVLLVTVPVVLALGTKLLVELPRIAAARQREARAESRNLILVSFLDYFQTLEQEYAQPERLRKAQQLDPENPRALTCLATVLGQGHFADAAAELDANPALLTQHRGLQLLRDKARERRIFFRDDEVAALRESRDGIDLLVLILDRILAAEDSQAESDHAAVLPILGTAILRCAEADPLLFGLQAHAASRAKDRRLLDLTCDAIRGHWGDDPVVNAWRLYAMSYVDPEAARRDTERLLALDPLQPLLLGLLCSCLDQLGKREEALAAVREAAAKGMPPGRMLSTEAVLLADLRREAELRQLLPQVLAEPKVRQRTKRKALALLDPEAARQMYREALAADAPSFEVLAEALRFAETPADHELVEATCRRCLAQFPERSSFAWILAKTLAVTGRRTDAAQVLRDLTPPRWRLGSDASMMVACFSDAKDWPQLQRIATLWYAEGQPADRARACYYLGLANARQGQHAQAAEWLTRHKRMQTDLGKPAYKEAFLEEILLGVDPAAPAELRDPAKSRELLRRTLTGIRRGGKEPGPWALAIGAEVEFANGDRQQALASATAAQALLERIRRGTTTKGEPDKVESSAPGDLAERLAAALARYGTTPTAVSPQQPGTGK